MATTAYDKLARLLCYPERDYPARMEEAWDSVQEEEEVRDRMEILRRQILGLSHTELEELFAATFDLNPVCTPEIGRHLFGERYERGAFMARLRQEFRKHGIEESHELPDHLTHVLPLLGRMERDEAANFAHACVLPALEKMIESLRAKTSPFLELLQAIAGLIRIHHPVARGVSHA